jgi:hypothetical protein
MYAATVDEESEAMAKLKAERLAGMTADELEDALRLDCNSVHLIYI